MNKLHHLGEAIRAGDLQGSLTTQRLHYYVKMAHKATMSKEGMVIDIVDLCQEDGTATTFTSSWTEPLSSSLSSQLLCWSDAARLEQDNKNLVDNQQDNIPLQLQPPAAQQSNTMKPRKVTRKLSWQASVARLEAKQENNA